MVISRSSKREIMSALSLSVTTHSTHRELLSNGYVKVRRRRFW
jgi:hypothetical protein